MYEGLARVERKIAAQRLAALCQEKSSLMQRVTNLFRV
jgi:hypothetical protein